MSVLQDMTKGLAAGGVMQRKADKATKLTPVAGESATTVGQMAASLPDVPGAFLTKEQLRDTAITLREQAAQLVAVADGLDAISGLTSTESEAPKDIAARAAAERKSAEKLADEAAATLKSTDQEAFDASLAAKAEAAQAVAFAAADAALATEPVAVVNVDQTGSWVCPNHGDAAVVTLKARGGRTIRACDKCDNIET